VKSGASGAEGIFCSTWKSSRFEACKLDVEMTFVMQPKTGRG
jgi:hypothetical protein